MNTLKPELTLSDLCAVLCRGLALMYVIDATRYFALLVPSALTGAFRFSEQGYLYQFISFTLLFSLALGLWFYAKRIGDLVSGRYGQTKVGTNINFEQAMFCICVIFGFYLFSQSFSEATRLSMIFFEGRWSDVWNGNKLSIIRPASAVGLYILGSLFFTFGAGGLRRLIIMIRKMG